MFVFFFGQCLHYLMNSQTTGPIRHPITILLISCLNLFEACIGRGHSLLTIVTNFAMCAVVPEI